MSRSLGVCLTLGCLVTLGCLAFVTNAVALNPVQREVLFRIRDEMPSLATLDVLPWTNSSIDALCTSMNVYGIVACNSTGWISKMSFSGSLALGEMGPSFGDMEGLTHLYAYNAFSGPMQPTLGNLALLEDLEFHSNPLLQGPLPSEWRNLKSLKRFRWYDANTNQPIPDWIGDEWPQLTQFTWKSLNATGPFPSWISSLPSLTLLDISDNQLEGSISSSLTSLTALKSLFLQNNQFSGSLPSNWASMTALTNLYLDNNQFSGNLPSNFAPNLEFVYAPNNQFSGSIPQSWMDIHSIAGIDLYNNDLQGPLPWPSQPSLSSLIELYLSKNPLIGASIPSAFFQLPQFKYFYADDTQINGAFPNNVPSGCALTEISMRNAILSSSLPSHLDFCSELTYVDLENCGLTGQISASSGSQFTDFLEHLNLAHNHLEGSLPDDWSIFEGLRYLNLASNQLSGSISQSLINLTDFGLKELYLNENHFELCGDSRLNENSIPEWLQCNATAQVPQECGCVGVWTHCLDSEMIPVCPPSSPPTSQGTSPNDIPTGASSPHFPSWIPTTTRGQFTLISIVLISYLLFSSF